MIYSVSISKPLANVTRRKQPVAAPGAKGKKKKKKKSVRYGLIMSV